jgi:hypothetical protein
LVSVTQVRHDAREQARVAPGPRSRNQPLALGGAPEVGGVLVGG